MARKLRITGSWLKENTGGRRETIPFETGLRTYTEAHQGEFILASNTSVTLGLGQLTQGNYLYCKCTTGPFRASIKAGTSSLGITLLSGGFMVIGGATFSSLRAHNKAATQSTFEFRIVGD
jgi:hypothetical protein